MSKTNVQVIVERQRALYEGEGLPTFLEQLIQVHQISIRDYAEIFGISKSHAENVLKHKVMPSLELGVRMARYWECAVEDLFGWRIDDDGARRPLLVAIPGTTQVVRLKKGERAHRAVELAQTRYRKQKAAGTESVEIL